MLTLLTCTGGRPQAFALLERWIAEQFYLSDYEWLVVDDCEPATPLTMGQIAVPAAKVWKPGDPQSLTANVLTGLRASSGEKILFIEDDECYLPGYLSSMSAALDHAIMAGQTPAMYYNVAYRCWRRLANGRHASLCQTGIRSDLLYHAIDLCARTSGPFLDLTLWGDLGFVGSLSRDQTDVVSIKGMPGRPGIGVGHRPAGPSWTADPEGAMLTALIGAERAALYLPFYEPGQQRPAAVS
jgi:hypothetical protein